MKLKLCQRDSEANITFRQRKVSKSNYHTKFMSMLATPLKG